MISSTTRVSLQRRRRICGKHKLTVKNFGGLEWTLSDIFTFSLVFHRSVLDKRASSLGMDGRAQKSVPKKEVAPKPSGFCTYNDTGSAKNRQQFYECLTCKLDAVCEGCIKNCHANHKVKKDKDLDMGKSIYWPLCVFVCFMEVLA